MQRAFDLIVERLEERKQLHERMIAYESKNGTVTEEFQARKAVEVVEKAIEIVNQVASEYGGWIPCSERFPNNGDYILLSFSNFSVPLVGRWEEDEDGGAFYIGDETESCVLQDIFVNAWQPLPPVYKAESEE